MATPEPANFQRAIDLLWKNYDSQVLRTQKYADRVTIVLGATIAAIGLTIKFASLSESISKTPVYFSLLFLVLAFVFAALTWWPRRVSVPSSSDVDVVWKDFVNLPEENSAANMMGDLCKAIELERKLTYRISQCFLLCMLFCGGSVFTAILSHVQ